MVQPTRRHSKIKPRGEPREDCDICGVEYYESELREQDGWLKCPNCIDIDNPQEHGEENSR
jgi:hypothetical protein